LKEVRVAGNEAISTASVERKDHEILAQSPSVFNISKKNVRNLRLDIKILYL